MSEKFVNQLIKALREDLEVESSNDYIGDLFEERAENIHTTIGSNSEYKKQTIKICDVEDEIKGKIYNYQEIIPLVEKHNSIMYKRNYLCEKLMYKQGVLDGILFIIEGAKKINITSFLKNCNQKHKN